MSKLKWIRVTDDGPLPEPGVRVAVGWLSRGSAQHSVVSMGCIRMNGRHRNQAQWFCGTRACRRTPDVWIPLPDLPDEKEKT